MSAVCNQISLGVDRESEAMTGADCGHLWYFHCIPLAHSPSSTTRRAGAFRFRGDSMDVFAAPLYLKVFVTFGCNLKCVHCVHGRISSKVEPALSPAFLGKLEGFVAEAKSLNPNLRVYLSGGEPLLSPRFFQAARIIRSLGLTYKTISNGTLLGERYGQLLESPPYSIWITFNGVGERHDAIVGLKGGYEQLCQSLRRGLPHLQRANVRVGAVLMINALTFDCISDDLDQLASFGFDEVVVQHLSFISETDLDEHQEIYKEKFGAESRFCFGEGADGLAIDPLPLYRELVKVRRREYPFRTVIFPPLFEKKDLEDYYSDTPQRWRSRRCPRALKEVSVLPDGTVTACFAHKIGHIDQSLSQILSSEPWISWKQTFSQLSEPLPGCMRCHRLYV